MIMMSDANINDNDVDDHEHEANNNSHRIQQLLLHQQHQPQPTRINSFLRQNQYKTGTKILVPLFYLALTIFYFHSLLFRNVESIPSSQHHQQQENSNNDSNLIQITKEDDSSPLLLLEPRSLAHVALANAEIAWRRHVDREKYLLRQAQRRDERAKEWRMKQQQQQQEQENNVENVALLRGAGNFDDTNDAASLTQNSAGDNNEDANKSPSKNSTKEELEAAAEHLKNLVRGGTAGSLAAAIVAGRGAASERKLPSTTTMAVGGERMAIHGSIDSTKNHNYRRTSSSPGFLSLLLIMFTCSMLRVCVQVLVVQQEHGVVAGGGRGGIGLDDSDDDDDGSNNNASTTTHRRRRGRGASRRSGEGGEQQPHGTMGVGGVLTAAARLRRRAQISAAQHQFQRFANRLNAERAANGERQISIDTLRHLVHARDFNGNDYDRLSNFVEENGPAIGSFFSAIGATDAEINRCPSRILMENDELLRWRMSSSAHSGRRGSSSSRQGVEDQPIQQQQTDPPSSSCAVCLEQYQVGEMVRTIPCFHTFHATCIDPWLAQRAECPVCKHSAIG
jgi:hypothetical protein